MSAREARVAAATSRGARAQGAQGQRDTSIATYAARRRFPDTPEPPASASAAPSRRAATLPIFVVQQHHARALHWDFRLQHGNVLWSWAVPKGPSMDPAVKRLAVRTEDHPLAYADFEGEIPRGNYGAGHVERWDHGAWAPVGDAAEGIARGELKFDLAGERLRGRFVLVRLKRRANERGENWLLIKEADAAAAVPRAKPARRATVKMPAGARKAALPKSPRPQLATATRDPPVGEAWLNEIKFDGYRLLLLADGKAARLLTRSGHDWADRLPALAREFAAWGRAAVVDGELIALGDDGISDFGALQAALAAGRERSLVFQAFDLLHLDGHDLTRCRLDERKALLQRMLPATPRIRFTSHLAADATNMRKRACAMGLEGIISKRADAPYVAGRSRSWLKLKCQGREEFVVLGFTPPSGSRVGIGALHVGYHDPKGRLHYAGGVGTGFDDRQLRRLSKILRPVRATPPAGMVVDGEAPDAAVRWVDPGLVVEVQFAGWSPGGRLRHAVFLGEREDKAAREVMRKVPKPGDEGGTAVAARAAVVSVRPRRKARAKPDAKASLPAAPFIVARAPGRETVEIEGVRLTHPARELWPGITKEALARYWVAVAQHALPGLARRPLALLRCPTGIGGEHFFQKHSSRGQPGALRAGTSQGDPFLAIDDAAGLVACAQLSAIELHPWGATEDDPDRPDQLVFDLDPGDGVAFPTVVQAALMLRDALARLKLASFCRTTGGKGLHLVVPLTPAASWDAARGFAKGFAETIAAARPGEFVTTVQKAKRQGRILIDWLRNGRGATAIGSFSPRARPGATVAAPLAWREVTARLDPGRFTIATMPARLSAQKRDPWAEFHASRARIPEAGSKGKR